MGRFILPAVIVLVLDQISKHFFWNLGKNFDVIGDVLRITLVKNSGAAFGMLQNGRVFLIAASILASTLLVYIALRLPKEAAAKRVFLGMIFGGALGNLIDRIHPGEVIDFIDMGIGSYRWPVYNIADTAVTTGGLLLIIIFTRTRDTPDAG